MSRLKGIIKSSNTVVNTMHSLVESEIRESNINFDYDLLLELSETEKQELINCEKSLLFQGKQFGNVTFEIGKSLYKAKEVLKKTDGDSFMKWYEALGLNKDQVSIFMGRYQLTIDYPNAKERILMLSDVAVKETLNKKTDTEVLNKVLSGEISTSQQIKLARKNISRDLEIDEAEILDNIDKVVFTVSMEMIDDLEKKINKIKKSINKNLGMELKSYHKLERIIEILKEVK